MLPSEPARRATTQCYYMVILLNCPLSSFSGKVHVFSSFCPPNAFQHLVTLSITILSLTHTVFFLWQVKVTEIVDVTDADSSVILSPDERENNTHLEFDDEWNEENLACSSSWLPQQAIQIEGWFSLKLYKCFENPMSVIGHLHCEVIKLFFFFNNKIFYYCFPYFRAARMTKLT